MNYPLISIVIVTRNSEETLSKILQSVKNQTYPKESLEVLVIDGRSTDKTRQIVKEFRFKLIDNPKIGFVPGKHSGYLISKGEYLMYVDSDDEIENPDSLKIKITALKSDKRIKGITSSGYKNPAKFASISHYLNEFGDPFSYFIYRSAMNYNFFLRDLSCKYKIISENKNFIAMQIQRSVQYEGKSRY